MKVDIVDERGFDLAMYGIGLSYGLTSNMSYGEYLQDIEMSDKLYDVSLKLAPKGKGHNKFLEHLDVFMIVDAPRYFFAQLDTYRVGVSKNSESTMHTILKVPFTQESFGGFDFDEPIPETTIQRLESLRHQKKWRQLKRELPESFIQRRTIKLSYMNLRNVIIQRVNHRLAEWQYFCGEVMDQVRYPEYLEDVYKTRKENV